jgi:hypothetical protein
MVRHGDCDVMGRGDVDVPQRHISKRDLQMSVTRISATTASASTMRRRAGDVVAVCTALVPVEPAAPTTAPSSLNRPDPSFVAHLIATAEQSPQTRVLRRAAIAEVESAYRSVANQNHPATPSGLQMRRSV